jgi:hypothetical protein
VAALQQPFANVRADESRPASNQKIHRATLTTDAAGVENSGILPTNCRARSGQYFASWSLDGFTTAC